MASTILVTCPECDKQLKAPEDVLGKKIRCKHCGETFLCRSGKPVQDEKETARAPGKSAKPAPGAAKAAKPAEKSRATPATAKAPAAKSVDPDNDMTPYGVTQEYLGARCPDCTEPLDEGQVVCLNCGFNVQTRRKGKTVRIKDTTGGDIFLWVLPAILCIFVFIGVLTAQILYIFLVTAETFGGEDSWGAFLLANKFGKIYTSLITIFICYKCGRFAIKRLILENKPPEIVHDKDDDEEDEDD